MEVNTESDSNSIQNEAQAQPQTQIEPAKEESVENNETEVDNDNNNDNDNDIPTTTEEPDPEENFSPEYLQKKLYFLLDQLKLMHAELPEKYQMRISYEFLTVLANTLLNDTLFAIVKGLMEIQHVTEKHLQQLREQIENEYQNDCKSWQDKISDSEELEHILALMKIKHKKKLREIDIKIIEHLDQKVKDQQSTLERAGVPGFHITENIQEIKIQMHLLDFILRLSQNNFKS